MKQSIVRRALSYLRPYVFELWVGQVSMLVAAAAGLVLPLCSRLLIDALTGHRVEVPHLWLLAAGGGLW